MNFLVSGLINIESNLHINKFPLEYNPVNYPFFGIHSCVSGVGLNVCKALSVLGNNVQLLSLIGNDFNGESIISTLHEVGISTSKIHKLLKNTPQSIILYDSDGKRQIHVDLKDIQESEYPEKEFDDIYMDYDVHILCNINFSRSLFEKSKKAGKLIASDVHVISSVNDAYNSDFMKYADILFLSDEMLGENCKEFVRKISEKYQNEIIVVGQGAKGALMYVRKDNHIEEFKAIPTREVVNTIGAGDALFSAFLNFYVKSKDPYLSLKKAMLFASYKIGENGAANGFLTEDRLDALFESSL